MPSLRFPGFSDEWQLDSINQIFEIRNGYTPSKANKDFWEGGTIPWFRMEDIRQNGRILSDAIQHITPNAVKGSGLFSKNSIILATTATIGEHAMLIVDSQANQQFTNLKIRKLLTTKLLSEFVFYRFFKIDEWAKKNTNAGGLLSVDIEGLKRLQFPIPSITEQKKIASFLSLLDDRIATQRKIIEKLDSLMVGIYNEVILSQTSTVQLKDVCNVCKGEQINASELSDSGEFYVMNGGTTPSGYLNKYNTPAHTISISEGGNSCGYVQFNNRPFWSGGHCYTLNLKGDINARFLYHALKANEPSIMKLRIGSGLPNIQKKDLERFVVFVPCFDEQLEIVKGLDAIYQKLQLERDLLISLNKEKLFLLNSLFI